MRILSITQTSGPGEPRLLCLIEVLKRDYTRRGSVVLFIQSLRESADDFSVHERLF